jgi:hypothetical protein
METPQWHAFAQIYAFNDFMHAYPTRIHEFSKGAKTASEVGLIDPSRGGGYE